MLLSELGEKELINLNNGARLGPLVNSDLLIDEDSGKIISLLIPDKKISLKIFSLDKGLMEIPWNSIRKIGYDMIIVELDS